MFNMALFGMTAKQWRIVNPDAKGNIQDISNIEKVVVLSNMESIKALLIRQDLSQSERLEQVNKVAIAQMRSLLNNKSVKRLK